MIEKYYFQPPEIQKWMTWIYFPESILRVLDEWEFVNKVYDNGYVAVYRIKY